LRARSGQLPVRVIAGHAKGTRLARPPAGTRPVSDRAREGLFAALGDVVVGARCLDLYAGTGAVGIEALSRGASHSVFVDSSAPAIRVIRDNLSRTGFEEQARVARSEALRFLSGSSGPFDLAFVDPPYALPVGRLRSVLEALVDRLDRNATFVLTRPSRSSIDVIPVDFLTVRRLSYGDTLVLVCREES
jgi:16S rRNA (guanine966-N2)-methyltransferase